MSLAKAYRNYPKLRSICMVNFCQKENSEFSQKRKTRKRLKEISRRLRRRVFNFFLKKGQEHESV